MAKKNAVSAVIQREVQRIVAQRTIERVQMCKDAAKTAYNMAGMDFDSLPEQEKIDIVYKMMTR